MVKVFTLSALLVFLTGCAQIAERRPGPILLEPTQVPSTSPTPISTFAAPSFPNATAPAPSISDATAPASTPMSGAPMMLMRIQFPPGGTSTTINGNLTVNGIDRYVLYALAGQTLNVRVPSSQAKILLSINGADGDVLKSLGAGSANWSGQLRTTQSYFITLAAMDGVPASYTLEVSIPPLATPANLPKRIQLQLGGTSAALQSYLTVNGE